MRKIYILDPQLHSIGGHNLNHDEQLVRDLVRRDIPVKIYGRLDCRVLCEGLTVEPLFTMDVFSEVAKDAHVWAIENFHGINEVFFADLCRIPADQFTAYDFVYFPNLIQNQLYAVSIWLSKMPLERRPVVGIMLRWLNHAMDYMQSRANKDLIAFYYRFAAQRLIAVQPRALLCSDTFELTQIYSKITGISFLELPNPMDVSALIPDVCTHKASSEPIILYQGHSSPLRGFHFLPDIIERCAQLNPRPKFLIQVQNEADIKNTGLGEYVKLLEGLKGPHVELVYGNLESKTYYHMLSVADIVLLPYSPSFYGYGSSGVFTEAASAGKVIVVSPGTVPARLGKEHNLGVVVATKWEPASIADAVIEALKNYEKLKIKALEGAAAYRSVECASVLWDRVFGGLHHV